SGRIHDDGDPEETDEGSGNIPAVRAEPVERHTPQQRSGDEHSAVGGEDTAEVRIGLQGGDETVDAEGNDAGADPDPAPVLAHTLPHQPGTADLGDGSQDE